MYVEVDNRCIVNSSLVKNDYIDHDCRSEVINKEYTIYTPHMRKKMKILRLTALNSLACIILCFYII